MTQDPRPARNTVLYPVHPVLMVDDELQATQSMAIALKSKGISHTLQCQQGSEVMDIMEREQPEVVVLDLDMPGIPGEALLGMINRDMPEVPVIIATSTDEIETAVRCMRTGAFDYLVKPLSRERLVSAVKRAIEVRALRRECSELRLHVLSNELKYPEAFAEFHSVTPRMRSIFAYVESMASSSEPVLITGETGVGKEIMAHSICRVAGVERQLVTVNVAGLDDNSFSDTLFGHCRGAFTGATEGRSGLIEKAQGGALFMDEIGDLSMALQVKLLRLLQEHEYFPMGSDVPKSSSARLIFATNLSVEQLQDNHRFRPDLFYRICRYHVHLPPLRERRDDLPYLVGAILDRVATKTGKKSPAVSATILELLARYSFPGNVRELESMIFEAMAAHHTGPLSVKVFERWVMERGGLDTVTKAPEVSPLLLNTGSALMFPPVLPTLREVQSLLIDEALRRANDNQAVAAKMLGVTRQALNRRLLNPVE